MKALAYALAGCFLLLAAPATTADDCPERDCPPDLPPYCTWFSYGLEYPYVDVDPECLVPH